MKLSNLLTEPDNVTLCPVRVILMLGIIGYAAGAVMGFLDGALKADIDTLGQFVKHVVMFITGGGASIGIKSGFKGDAQ